NSLTFSANSDCWAPVISADGNYVAFTSKASNLLGSGTYPNFSQVYLYERATGAITWISSNTGIYGQADSPAISADGSYVAFSMGIRALFSTGPRNLYLFERATNSLHLITHLPGDSSASNVYPPGNEVISADGRYIAYTAYGDPSTLVSGATTTYGD